MVLARWSSAKQVRFPRPCPLSNNLSPRHPRHRRINLIINYRLQIRNGLSGFVGSRSFRAPFFFNFTFAYRRVRSPLFALERHIPIRASSGRSVGRLTESRTFRVSTAGSLKRNELTRQQYRIKYKGNARAVIG